MTDFFYEMPPIVLVIMGFAGGMLVTYMLSKWSD